MNTVEMVTYSEDDINALIDARLAPTLTWATEITDVVNSQASEIESLRKNINNLRKRIVALEG